MHLAKDAEDLGLQQRCSASVSPSTIGWAVASDRRMQAMPSWSAARLAPDCAEPPVDPGQRAHLAAHYRRYDASATHFHLSKMVIMTSEQPRKLAPSAPTVPVPTNRDKAGCLIGIFGSLLVLAVCAGLVMFVDRGAKTDDWKGLGESVVRPSPRPAPTPTWQPPNMFLNPNPVLEIRHRLEEWVLRSAGAYGAIESTCDDGGFTGATAATFDCTVIYKGQRVVYRVDAKPKGLLFEWDATTSANIVTREGILQLFATRYTEANGWSNLRCDPLPEIVLAPVRQPLPQVCYAKLEDKKTSKILIKPRRNGEPNLETQFQP